MFYFTKSLEHDKWDYSVNIIPPEAVKVCSFISYRENNGIMVEDGRNTIYYERQNYYMMIESLQTVLSVEMSNQAAINLLNFLDIDISDEGSTFADEETKNGNTQVDENSYPFSNLTYEGMLAASDKNCLVLRNDSNIIQSISSNKEIYEFMMTLDTSKWSRVENIPDVAEQSRLIVFYQEGRRQYAGEKMEQWRLVLYYDTENYYADMLIADNGHGDINAHYPERFMIPDEIGIMLHNIK